MELNQMLTWALSEATPSGDANMDMIMRKVLKYKALEEAGKGASDLFSSGENIQDLEKMNMKLEIMQKKRQLGMDYNTSQDFEDAVNGPDDAVKGVLSNRFANLSDKRAKLGRNPQSLEAIFKDAHIMDSPGHTAVVDRRKPVFKIAESAVGYGEKSHSGLDLIKKFLSPGGSPHANGTSSALWKRFIR